MKLFFKRTILGICIFVGLSFFTSIFAIDYTPLTTIPGVSTKGTPLINPSNLVLGIYTVAIGIGSILAVIMVIIGGIKYTVMESFDVKTDAKKQITAAFLGLILLLASYLILKTINKDLLKFNDTLPKSNGGGIAQLIADRANINAMVDKLKKEYDAENAKVADAQRQEKEIQNEKNILQARYNAISDKNSPEAKALETQIGELNIKYAEKINEVAVLLNNSQKIKIDGLNQVDIERIAVELSAGNVDMANAALQRLANREQQKIELLKKQNAPQEEIQKAEAEKNYDVTKNASAIYTTQALREIATKAGVYNRSKITDLKSQISSEAERTILLIGPVNPEKAESLKQEASANIKKIDDALTKLNRSLPCLNRDTPGC